MQLTCIIPPVYGEAPAYKAYQDCALEMLSNRWLDLQHDGVVLSLSGKVAFCTGSYVVQPIFFGGGNIGDLAVNGAVNNLAMCGALAKYLSLSFIIEEGLPMNTFREVLQRIKEAAYAAGVTIVTGDTKVVGKGMCNGLMVNTTGIGTVHSRAAIDYNRIEAGDVIIISGQPGNHGIAVRGGNAVQSDTAPLHEMVFRILDVLGQDVKFLRDPTREGVAGALYEVAGLTGLGFALTESAIPVDAAVAVVCSEQGLDVLYEENAGLMLAIVKKESAAACVALLRNCEGGSNATIAGEVVAHEPGRVVLRKWLEVMV